MQKIIDAIEAGKLTDDHNKAFIRNAATLNSVNKDELHRQYNELYDRLKLFEDMYFDINERVEKMLAADKKAVQEFITTPDAPVPPKLVTVTYAEDRLRHFEQERTRAKWRYETTMQAFKDAKPHELWHDEKMSNAGRELQFYDDVVAMLKGETDTRAHGRWINCSGGDATCSVCRIRQRGIYDDDNEQRYCGCCGAIMDGGEECEND